MRGNGTAPLSALSPTGPGRLPQGCLAGGLKILCSARLPRLFGPLQFFYCVLNVDSDGSSLHHVRRRAASRWCDENIQDHP